MPQCGGNGVKSRMGEREEHWERNWLIRRRINFPKATDTPNQCPTRGWLS